jgi:hypothetical protein
MLAGAQRRSRDCVVRIGGCSDDQGIDLGEHSIERHVRCPGLPPHGLRPFVVAIIDANQRGAFGGDDLQRMVAAEMAGTGDADAEFGSGHSRTRGCLPPI